MVQPKVNLRAIDRSTWLAQFDDGIWDIWFGLLGLLFGVLVTWFFPSAYVTPFLAAFGVGLGLSRQFVDALKQRLTYPRAGYASLSPARKRRVRSTTTVLNAVLVVLGLLAFVAVAGLNVAGGAAALRGVITAPTDPSAAFGLMLAITGGVVSWSASFDRGVAYAALYGAGMLVAIALDTAVPFLAIPALVLLVGICLLVRFLRRYQPATDGADEEDGDEGR